MASPHAYMSCPCRKGDWTKTILVFGGLFISAIAICGTLEARSPIQATDEVTVADNENAIGPVGADPAPVRCNEEKKGIQAASLIQQCAQETIH